MINVLIIEDEAVAARNLIRMLRVVSEEIEIIAQIESVEKSIEFLSSNQPDLIFMDIHLSDGNAFQIFDNLLITTPIIFTTAFDKYILRAFKQYSVDYILKPVDQKDLRIAVDKFNQHFRSKEDKTAINFRELIPLLKQERNYKTRFLIQVGKRLRPIKIEEVAYFFTEKKTTYIQTFEDRNYPVDYSLAQLENELNPMNFFRINRQFLISNKAIEDIYYLSTTRLKINLLPKKEQDVLVTIDKISKFKKWLG